MHRESDTHGPRQDDTLKHELEDTLRGNGPTDVEEWQDPEPLTEDDPSRGEDVGPR
jgi:hypothetical protein